MQVRKGAIIDQNILDKYKGTSPESRRNLTTFQIGADLMSSTILMRVAAVNEFKTSNSAVISAVIDEMKRTLDHKIREVKEQISL